MRLTTSVVLLALAMVSLSACSSTDTDPDSDTNIAGGTLTILDAPFAIGHAAVLSTTSTWSYDFSPAPHDGDFIGYWSNRSHSFSRHMTNICDNIMYNLFNTNRRFPPYDRFSDSYRKDLTQILKTVDTHLFRYDWDDPYVN